MVVLYYCYRCCVIKCYEFVLFREAVGSFAENQRITAIRKVYHRGIITPMLNVEYLWKDYCAFEQVWNLICSDN